VSAHTFFGKRTPFNVIISSTVGRKRDEFEGEIEEEEELGSDEEDGLDSGSDNDDNGNGPPPLNRLLAMRINFVGSF
jgi:hypothetical protein